MNRPKDKSSNRFPSQARFILGNEAAERYSYYGMKGILALYITNVLLMSEDRATTIIHLFTFVNYFMPLLGAWVSDRFWGRYNTILYISLFYCAGHGVLAMSDLFGEAAPRIWCLYVGLGLIAFGSGGIKPCVSAFMGDQFRPDQSHLLRKAYAAFYWVINLGSTAAFLTIPFVRKEFGYAWAFGIPGIAMALATFVFWLGTRRYVMVPPSSKTKQAGFLKVWWFAWTHRDRRDRQQGFWETARQRFTDLEVDAARSVAPILSIFAMIPVFWALFDQTFSTWVMQGERMRPAYLRSAEFKPREIDPEAFVVETTQGTNAAGAYVWSLLSEDVRATVQDDNVDVAVQRETLTADLNRLLAAGPLFSVEVFSSTNLSREAQQLLRGEPGAGELPRLNRLLLEENFGDGVGRSYRVGPEEMLSANPILVMILVPIMTLLVYPRLGRLATPLKRMSAGMFLAGFSFVIVAWFQVQLNAGEELSVLWQTLPYVVLTTAEVLVSTTGLEFAFREAAPSMKSTIMGFWSLTVAVGNLLVIGATEAAGAMSGESGHAVSLSPQMFLFYAVLTFVVAVVFSVIAGRYRYRDAAAAEGR